MNDTIVLENGALLSGLSNIDENLEVHYIVYKIINNVNGKHYYGKHHTKNPFDNYMGSGILILKALEKYGEENFSKIILFDYATDKESSDKELELVPLSSCYPFDKLSYNLKEGGNGGYPNNSGDKHWLRRWKTEIPEKYDAYIEKLKIRMDKYYETHNGAFYGKQRPDHSEKMSGENNPMYGKNMRKVMGEEKFSSMRENQIKNNKAKDIMKNIKKDPIKYAEWKKHLSESSKGKKLSENTKKKIGNFGRGKHWFNNGIREIFTEMCPNGYVKGRLPRIFKDKKLKINK